MTPEQAAALRASFPAEKVAKLPRVTCGPCRDEKRAKHCANHERLKCDECQSFVTTAHMHLDYVGHADHEQGTAPTWRGEYGVVSLPITHPSIEVRDPDRLVAWCAEHHPTEVERVRRVREAYLSYIRQHYVMSSDADGLPVVLDPTTEEPVPGLTWQPGGQPGALSIRPTAAAKREARQYAEQRLRALTGGEV